jgi:hypothetical protein
MKQKNKRETFDIKDDVEYLNSYGFEVLSQIVLNDVQRDVLFYKLN